MPKVPKWIANAMEALFSGSYHPVIVTSTQLLDDQLKSIRFEGDFSGIKKDFSPGSLIEFRVNDTEFRHYTPSYFNKAEGVCEVLFYLHDKGPGSRWAQNIQKGDILKMIGPGGKMHYVSNADVHITFGDETSLGLFHGINMETIHQGHQFLGILELDEHHKDWPGFVQLPDKNVLRLIIRNLRMYLDACLKTGCKTTIQERKIPPFI